MLAAFQADEANDWGGIDELGVYKKPTGVMETSPQIGSDRCFPFF